MGPRGYSEIRFLEKNLVKSFKDLSDPSLASELRDMKKYKFIFHELFKNIVMLGHTGYKVRISRGGGSQKGLKIAKNCIFATVFCDF